MQCIECLKYGLLRGIDARICRPCRKDVVEVLRGGNCHIRRLHEIVANPDRSRPSSFQELFSELSILLLTNINGIVGVAARRSGFHRLESFAQADEIGKVLAVLLDSSLIVKVKRL